MNEATGVQLRFREALALHRQGKVADAERIYAEILQRQPNHFDATHMLGVAALQGRRTERGIELIRKAIALNGKVAAPHNNLGKAWLDLGRPADALGCFERAIALDADFVEPYVHRGAVLVRLQRLREALDSYQRAVALEPGNAGLHRNCGHLLSRLKRYDEALLAYDAALRLNPDLAGVEGYRLYTRMRLCLWDNLGAERAHLVASVQSGKPVAQPFAFLAAS